MEALPDAREGSMTQSLDSRTSQPFIHRFLGGPPLAVVGRLILLSILVGVILAAIGLDPWNIIESVERLLKHIWNMGFDAVAVALFPVGRGDRFADLVFGAARQGAARAVRRGSKQRGRASARPVSFT